MSAPRYTVGRTYRFLFVDGHGERVEYLGKERTGAVRFKFSSGEVWSGHTAPVVDLA